MSILNEVMKNTADAIREKTGTNELMAPMDFAEKIKGIVAGGVPIVNSIDQLDHNAELGSTACVVEPGSITETLISELPQPDSSIINMDTGFIDATSCPQVAGLPIIIPEGPIPVSVELTESEMLYFCSESVDLMNMTTGIVLGIFPQVVNNEIIALVGMYMNVTTKEQKEWLLFQIQDGVVTADQAAIDECNAYIKDLHYIGAMIYVMQGMSLTTEKLLVYDNVVKVMAGIPSKARVYLKKDNWEELDAKLVSDIDKVEALVDAKADEISIEEVPYSNVLSPNKYYTTTINTTGNVSYTLATSTDATKYSEYTVELKCTSTPSSVDFTDTEGKVVTIKWANNTGPVFTEGFTYIISITKNFGVFAQFINE